jgi:hypothetical protein
MKSLFTMCVILTTLIAGCGSASKSPTTQGVFADAPVVGVTYTCGTQTGVTGTGGTYTCTTGSKVTFSVGAITLCSATARTFMTPLSCAQATDSSANTSTASVLATVQFLQSISTTPASSGELTITSSELTAAANVTVDFATATQSQLLAAVDAVAGGATPLVPAATAQTQFNSTVLSGLSGSYSGTITCLTACSGTPGSVSGTWSATVTTSGSLSGTAFPTGEGSCSVSGQLVTGVVFSGTAVCSKAIWQGTVDTSQSPTTFSGVWADTTDSGTGTFTGTAGL